MVAAHTVRSTVPPLVYTAHTQRRQCSSGSLQSQAATVTPKPGKSQSVMCSAVQLYVTKYVYRLYVTPSDCNQTCVLLQNGRTSSVLRCMSKVMVDGWVGIREWMSTAVSA